MDCQVPNPTPQKLMVRGIFHKYGNGDMDSSFVTSVIYNSEAYYF
jgi:hypothetical protein